MGRYKNKIIATVTGFISSIIIAAVVTSTALVHAVPAALGRGSSSAPSYSSATTLSADTSLSGASYNSTTGGQNALLASGGTTTLSDFTVTKSGDSSGDDADFYGTNAAILAYNGATLNLSGGNITTSGSHANAVFAYGTGTINISDSTITTSSNNSGGVMVTGGGTLTATDLTVSTSGNSSAAIRSDRGGGTLTVNGGTYQTTGVGSPAIYSTADIIVNDATLVSDASEGVVVEGANSVTLDGVNLNDTNTTLNGNSETYKNIFLYQSMSGDASEGTATFTAKDSGFATGQGDTIFVTNTTANITLENVAIANADGALLRAQTSKWGNSGANGGHVTMNIIDQYTIGDIIVDNISTLALSLSGGTTLHSAINSDNQAQSLTLDLSADSTLVLTGDAYLTSLTNSVEDNSNIYLNGHKLYVAGVETAANTAEYVDDDEVVEEVVEVATDEDEAKDNAWVIWLVVGCTVAAIIIAAVIVAIILIRRKNHPKTPTLEDSSSIAGDNNNSATPDSVSSTTNNPTSSNNPSTPENPGPKKP